MAFILILIGAVVLVAGVRDTQDNLWQLVKGDFSGPGNFVYWFIAILVVGSLGYVERMRTFANTFLALIIIAMFLSNKGFFEKFTQQIGATDTTQASSSGASTSSAITGALNLFGVGS